MRETLGFNANDNSERKMISIVYGSDLVNVSFLNFQATSEDDAKVTMETTETAVLKSVKILYICKKHYFRPSLYMSVVILL